MKIVQIVTQMEAGGAQRVAMLLDRALQDRGYDTEVWFLYLKRPTYQQVPNVRVLFPHQPTGIDYVKIAFSLRKLLREVRPQVVITHTHYANILGLSIAKFCGIAQRIAVQHNPVHTYPKIAKWIDRIWGTTAVYSGNIAVSQVVIDSVANYPVAYRNRLQKIYNGIPQLTRQHSLLEVRARWQLPAHAPLLINVGRLALQKNQAILIEALLDLPDAHLLSIGDGELRATLETKVAGLNLQSRVHFIGEIKSEDVLDLLCISDVFVFPSLYEAMPMALVEAMGLGIPIVAGDIPAMREVLGDAGLLVPSDNAPAIAQAVRRVLDTPELADRLRQAAFDRSIQFSVEKMAASYERLFQ
ncbi:glycosyltransferase family 4 protein [Chamaesiphon sp. VAR_69_metabat_338]|uniref:glycosyltransferase family 4 protein n=1 Tax=Chamaesiphon sp. VAR_69_metabat_338 TaxID=2964704 RepID=UPI00286DF0CA|nr:glycosyltransferase family 4 protein [Chamaesiphon sp. VAR_69_metabat_338]